MFGPQIFGQPGKRPDQGLGVLAPLERRDAHDEWARDLGPRATYGLHRVATAWRWTKPIGHTGADRDDPLLFDAQMVDEVSTRTFGYREQQISRSHTAQAADVRLAAVDLT